MNSIIKMKNFTIKIRFSRLNDDLTETSFEITRTNRGDDAAYLKLSTRKELSLVEERERNYFFPVLPAIFAHSCAQGVTDLWPVPGTANRLFLNARKMHSLPFERSREREREKKKRILFYNNDEKKREKETEEEKRRERLFCPSSIFLTIFISERRRRSRVPVKIAFFECFTNTVKSLLQGGVRYPS